jgi:farnesyl-diphosphate farnesyltransferase
MESDSKQSYDFCRKILPQVSRTFAINIAVLTGNLHKAILVAYLFCRIADTVEDSEQLAPELRGSLLEEYIGIFSQRKLTPERIRQWSQPFAALSAAEPYNRLVQNSHLVMTTFLTLPESSQKAISGCVVEMSHGMRETVMRRQNEGAGLHTLETLNDLERYCYYVAGTVGIMLTRLFSDHAPAMSDGAVVTNIIKDCRDDFRRGWCYIPTQLAAEHNVPIERFFQAESRGDALEVLRELIVKAATHLDDALDYTLLIPRREVRMRLFCLWPLFFALKTLIVADGNPDLLTGDRPVKISRNQVYWTILWTTSVCWSNSLVRCAYRRIRKLLGR